MPRLPSKDRSGSSALKSGGASTQGEAAYQSIRKQILHGELQPGTILSERLLADRLQLGKAPIRVAIQRLASEGFVLVEARRGVVIASQSIQDVIDLFQIRHVIEQLAVKGIAGKLRPDQIERLRANLAELRAHAEAEVQTDSVEVDFAFHRLLCEFHGNRHMLMMLDRILYSLYREMRVAQLKHPARIWDSLREHEEVASAVISGSPEEAAALIEKHLRFGEQFVLSRRPS